jgi:hypothetical protein
MERGMPSVFQTPYMHISNPLVENYFFSGLTGYGVSLTQRLIDEYRKEFSHYLRLSDKTPSEFGLNYSFRGASDLLNILKKYNQPDLHKQTEDLVNEMKKFRNIK